MTTSTPLTTTDPVRPRAERRPRSAGWLTEVGATGVAGFFVAALVAGLATPGYSSRHEAVSALAALDALWAPVMIAGFLLLAVGLAATGLALWRLTPARAGRAAGVLVVLTSALMATAGLARQDCSDQRSTCVDFGEAAGASTSYWVHQYASLLGFLLLVVGLFLLARGVHRSGVVADLALPTRLVALASLVLTVAVVVGPPPVAAAYGWVQRAFLLLVFGWPVLVAVLHQRRVSPPLR
jgi:uncharacterized protein DUF998